MSTILLKFIVLTNLIFLPISPSEAFPHNEDTPKEVSNPKLIYPENSSKNFIGEDEFYKTLDKNTYSEYNKATFSLRKKITFKEVPNVQEVFFRKTNLNGEKINPQNHNDIHPNRQVYFLASFYQNETEEFHKFVVIDAETKKVLLGNNDYHKYENPYKV